MLLCVSVCADDREQEGLYLEPQSGMRSAVDGGGGVGGVINMLNYKAETAAIIFFEVTFLGFFIFYFPLNREIHLIQLTSVKFSKFMSLYASF